MIISIPSSSAHRFLSTCFPNVSHPRWWNVSCFQTLKASLWRNAFMVERERVIVDGALVCFFGFGFAIEQPRERDFENCAKNARKTRNMVSR